MEDSWKQDFTGRCYNETPLKLNERKQLLRTLLPQLYKYFHIDTQQQLAAIVENDSPTQFVSTRMVMQIYRLADLFEFMKAELSKLNCYMKDTVDDEVAFTISQMKNIRIEESEGQTSPKKRPRTEGNPFSYGYSEKENNLLAASLISNKPRHKPLAPRKNKFPAQLIIPLDDEVTDEGSSSSASSSFGDEFFTEIRKQKITEEEESVIRQKQKDLVDVLVEDDDDEEEEDDSGDPLSAYYDSADDSDQDPNDIVFAPDKKQKQKHLKPAKPASKKQIIIKSSPKQKRRG